MVPLLCWIHYCKTYIGGSRDGVGECVPTLRSQKGFQKICKKHSLHTSHGRVNDFPEGKSWIRHCTKLHKEDVVGNFAMICCVYAFIICHTLSECQKFPHSTDTYKISSDKQTDKLIHLHTNRSRSGVKHARPWWVSCAWIWVSTLCDSVVLPSDFIFSTILT